ncbi:integrase [Gossypium australe]|uniref:Integrase n=1 Tax=Gossypium australe TaxID=47621 RepID=A0A5B6WF78_9ROSI|nr:integrase [Gossypium australe]
MLNHISRAQKIILKYFLTRICGSEILFQLGSKPDCYSALLDIGASFNLLSFSVYQQLGLGELKPTSITLSHPFLATSNALINCRNDVLNFSFGNMTLELNVFNVCKQPIEDSNVHEVDFIEQLVHEQFINSKLLNPLENYSIQFEIDDETKNPCIDSVLNSFQGQDKNFYWKQKFEEL